MRPDLLSPRLLKEGATALEEPLSMLFNRSLEKCYFPVTSKDANVSPIYKKDDKSLPSNYRPFSLLSSIGKDMERCVHKHLYNYVIVNDLLTPLQSGFKHGDSTNFQLIHTYHSFCEAVDIGNEVRAVFCDVSKAFDRVWHRGLLYKLSCIGCSNPVVKCFLVISSAEDNELSLMVNLLIGPLSELEYHRAPFLVHRCFLFT